VVRSGSKVFAPFQLDAVNECLWRDRGEAGDERIRLTPKAFAVLEYLVGHAGRLVTEEELLTAVWPKVYVQPEAVKTQIHEIRKVLGDDPKAPRFIETLARRGYQFIAAVQDGAPLTRAAIAGSVPRLVGRDLPLRELSSCLQRALGARRQVVFVTGETGIGKTTLADECMRRAAIDVPGVRIARGQCVEGHGGHEAYYPILEAIGELCRGPGGAALVKILAAQAPTWLVQFPDLVTSDHREKLRQEFLGATRDRMLREIGDALETFCADAPLLLVLEDLHWADSCTVDFISTLARRRGTGKLMLLGTFRPLDMALVRHPLQMVKQDLLVHQLCRKIALEPLTEAEIAEYLVLEMPGTTLPEGLAALIYRHSEGNPLFMVATLDHLRARDLIGIEDGRCRFKVSPEQIHLEVPDSLRELIELQIDKLTAEEQNVLEIASVRGLSFTADEGAVGTAMDLETFERVCGELARRQHMVRRTGSDQFRGGAVSEAYEFAHALYRDVFYRRQPPSRRAAQHRRAAPQVRDASLAAACP